MLASSLLLVLVLVLVLVEGLGGGEEHREHERLSPLLFAPGQTLANPRSGGERYYDVLAAVPTVTPPTPSFPLPFTATSHSHSHSLPVILLRYSIQGP